MLIQRKKQMEVTVEKTDKGLNEICLYERDGYHLQACILTKNQSEKLAKFLLHNSRTS